MTKGVTMLMFLLWITHTLVHAYVTVIKWEYDCNEIKNAAGFLKVDKTYNIYMIVYNIK